MYRLTICALAKNENAYINEWVKYHVDLGVEFIYLYDNNDRNVSYVGDCIDAPYRDRVLVIDKRGLNLRSKQQVVYNEWLSTYAKDTEFCIFIDIDEFVVTDSLKGLLSQIPSHCDAMALNWYNYSDGGVIDGDETVSVRERFKTPAVKNTGFWNKCIKSIVRCDGRYIKAVNSHGFSRGKQPFVYCDCCGNQIELVKGLKFAVCKIANPTSYIAHYPTKSLREYLKYKVDRLGAVWNYEQGRLNYYFRFNDKTPDKMKYIADYYESACNG